MERARAALPVGGIRTRRGRLFIFVLVATITLGLAMPAQAGLGDLLDDVAEELPVVGGIVDPVLEGVEPVLAPVATPVVEAVEPVLAPVVAPVVEVVEPVLGPVLDPVVEAVEPVLGPVVDPVVDPIVDDVFTPAAENLIAPIVEPVVEEVLPPVVHGVVPPIDQIEVPPLGDDVTIPPIEAVTVPGTSGRADFPTIRTTLTNLNDPAPARENLPNGSTRILGNGTSRSLVLARSLQTALVDTAGTPPTVAGRLADSSSAGWLMGLTDWLRGTANSLADLLSIPLRLLELLARALLTAGSGLVAPASLALAFTIYAVRDRRWQVIRKTALD